MRLVNHQIFMFQSQNMFVKGIAEVKFMAPDYSHTEFVILTLFDQQTLFIIVVLHNGSDMHCFNIEY